MSGASRECWSGGYPQVWSAGVQAYLEAKRKGNFSLLEYAKSLGYVEPEQVAGEPEQNKQEENFDLGHEPQKEVIVPVPKAKAKEGLFKAKE